MLPKLIGPLPVHFSWVKLSGVDSEEVTGKRFVSATTTPGRLQKWDGQNWIDVTRSPKESFPPVTLPFLSSRVIHQKNQLRWVSPAKGSGGAKLYLLLSVRIAYLLALIIKMLVLQCYSIDC